MFKMMKNLLLCRHGLETYKLFNVFLLGI